jgi:hypothetical protein
MAAGPHVTGAVNREANLAGSAWGAVKVKSAIRSNCPPTTIAMSQRNQYEG